MRLSSFVCARAPGVPAFLLLGLQKCNNDDSNRRGFAEQLGVLLGYKSVGELATRRPTASEYCES